MILWKRLNKDITWISLLAIFALLIHLVVYTPLGFHRDEFLYLALGRHLDTGYWSNPPLIGLISFIAQHLPGNSLFTTRLIPAIAGALLVFLTGLITRELGGKRFAQVFACLTLISSVLILRGYSMLQPVPFDIFFWTLILYFFLRYIRTSKPVFILLIGISFGLGILNKYMVVFLAAGMMLAIIPTPYRRLWNNKYTWLAILIAFVLFLPNLLWQVKYHFPVIIHMSELARTQLVHVKRLNIITDQILMFSISSVVWFSGLIFLLASPRAKEYRVFGFIYIAVLGIFIFLRGKSYYTAGLYPFLFAAGGVNWEKLLKSGILKAFLLGFILLMNLPLVPLGIPIFPAKQLVSYFAGITRATGVDMFNRWEEGRIHPLPQDYADMLGWDELGGIVVNVYDSIPEKNKIMIYCENYGQAGAIEHYGAPHGLGNVACFSDSYLIWAPDSIPSSKTIFIYVNNELGKDVSALFAKIDSVGSITQLYARENGTTVYLCRQPRSDFAAFWAVRVKEVKAEILP